MPDPARWIVGCDWFWVFATWDGRTERPLRPCE